jgi:hypothetical protein
MTMKRIRNASLGMVSQLFASNPSDAELEKHCEPCYEDLTVDMEALRRLFETALDSGRDGTELDGWLAPRLHYFLRIHRRCASDRAVWSYLALTVGRAYVQHRFKEAEEGVTHMRLHGELLRNAISRLWWGAEMVRNGSSYENVPLVFKRVRTAQFALELKYSWSRAAAIAFTKVAEGKAGNSPLTDQEMKDLSKRINAYLSLTSLEALSGADVAGDDAGDDEWRSQEPPTADMELDASKLEGPTDGKVAAESIDELQKWFLTIVTEMTTKAA